MPASFGSLFLKPCTFECYYAADGYLFAGFERAVDPNALAGAGGHRDWPGLEAICRSYEYKGILDLIPDRQSALKHSRQSAKLSTLLADIRAWSPARRRNTEGEYKIELRKKLEELRYAINEEFGESNSDLVVEKAFVIETKKDPQLSDYDRLFGQAARHLQHFPVVIAVIFDVPSEDKFDNFKILVDVHLNKGKHTVEVVKK